MSREMKRHEIVLPCGEKVAVRELTWAERAELVEEAVAGDQRHAGLRYSRRLLEMSIVPGGLQLAELSAVEAGHVQHRVEVLNGITEDSDAKNA